MAGRNSDWLPLFELAVKSKAPHLKFHKAVKLLRLADRFAEVPGFTEGNRMLTDPSVFKDVPVEALYKSVTGSVGVREDLIAAAKDGKKVTEQLVIEWVEKDRAEQPTSKKRKRRAKGTRKRKKKRLPAAKTPDELDRYFEMLADGYRGPDEELNFVVGGLILKYAEEIKSAERLKSLLRNDLKRFTGSPKDKRHVVAEVAVAEGEPIRDEDALLGILKNVFKMVRHQNDELAESELRTFDLPDAVTAVTKIFAEETGDDVAADTLKGTAAEAVACLHNEFCAADAERNKVFLSAVKDFLAAKSR